jgi:hypothetical protein
MQPRVSFSFGPIQTLAVLSPCLLAACGGPLPITGDDAGPGRGDASVVWMPDAAASPADAALAPDAASPRDAGAPPAPSDPDLEACWPGHTCWLEGADVVGMDGADSTSIHVFDRAGRVFRQEGSAWVELPGIRERRVRRLHVVSRDDLFALTEHRDAPGFFVDRFDGTSWTTVFFDADGTFLAGFGSDNVWVRVTGGGFYRWDGTSWNSVPAIDDRFGEIGLDVVQSRHEPMLLPGPAPTAYAVVAGAVGVVMRFDGRFWTSMGALATGWARLGWADGEVRAIELHGTSLGEDAVMLQHDGVRWLPIGHAPPGRYLIGSNRGVFASAGDPRCRIELHSGALTYCADEGRALIVREGLDGPWSETRLPEATRPFAPALWGVVPPAYWAPGATAAVGTGPSSYVRLRREGEFVGSGQHYVDEVVDGVPSAMNQEDGEALLGTQIDRNEAGELFVLLNDFRLHRRAPGAVELETLYLPTGWTEGARLAAAPDGAWLVRGAQILRVRGTTVSVDAELASTGFEDAVNLSDLCVKGDDVWVLGTVGHRSREGRLWHRETSEAGEVSYRAVRLPTGFWGGARLERRGNALYVTQLLEQRPVVRIPIERLTGEALEGGLEELAIGDGPLRGVFEERLGEVDLWVGSRGPWLLTATRVAWVVD